jgi:hypothetical protein
MMMGGRFRGNATTLFAFPTCGMIPSSFLTRSRLSDKLMHLHSRKELLTLQKWWWQPWGALCILRVRAKITSSFAGGNLACGQGANDEHTRCGM